MKKKQMRSPMKHNNSKKPQPPPPRKQININQSVESIGSNNSSQSLIGGDSKISGPKHQTSTIKLPVGTPKHEKKASFNSLPVTLSLRSACVINSETDKVLFNATMKKMNSKASMYRVSFDKKSNILSVNTYFKKGDTAEGYWRLDRKLSDVKSAKPDDNCAVKIFFRRTQGIVVLTCSKAPESNAILEIIKNLKNEEIGTESKFEFGVTVKKPKSLGRMSSRYLAIIRCQLCLYRNYTQYCNGEHPEEIIDLTKENVPETLDDKQLKINILKTDSKKSMRIRFSTTAERNDFLTSCLSVIANAEKILPTATSQVFHTALTKKEQHYKNSRKEITDRSISRLF
eukprot:UN29513